MVWPAVTHAPFTLTVPVRTGTRTRMMVPVLVPGTFILLAPARTQFRRYPEEPRCDITKRDNIRHRPRGNTSMKL
jgi:hypothetical protein